MYISILDQLFSTSFIYVVSISINVSNRILFNFKQNYRAEDITC